MRYWHLQTLTFSSPLASDLHCSESDESPTEEETLGLIKMAKQVFLNEY